MFDRFINPFKSDSKKRQITDEEYQQFYELKQKGLEQVLGKMYDLVGHAIIPFQIGGTVDLYYFPNAVDGTGFATMELIEPDGSGPRPSKIGIYELVAFTKHKVSNIINPGDVMVSKHEKQNLDNEKEAFEKIERRICGIFTAVGRYSFEAVLNPLETIEVPGSTGEPNRCLIMDEYKSPKGGFRIGYRRFELLLLAEVFRSEMEYAMKHGSRSVIDELIRKGYYPFSDLDRKPVV